jgi:hypothetical protein
MFFFVVIFICILIIFAKNAHLRKTATEGLVQQQLQEIAGFGIYQKW